MNINVLSFIKTIVKLSEKSTFPYLSEQITKVINGFFDTSDDVSKKRDQRLEILSRRNSFS